MDSEKQFHRWEKKILKGYRWECGLDFGSLTRRGFLDDLASYVGVGRSARPQLTRSARPE